MELILDISTNLNDEKYIEFTNLLIDTKKLEEVIQRIFEIENFISEKPVYISILLTTNEEIQIINKNFRNIDKPTDVISFAYNDSEDGIDIGPYNTLGDIVISLERVTEQAIEYNHSFEREFYYILTHGILHILGYDHIDEEEKKEMRKHEELILEKLGYTREK